MFEKIDTKEIRTMPRTLNDDIQTNNAGRKIFSNDTIVCWGLDVNAWRDVKINTIIEWYEGYPKGERIMGRKQGETHREFKARMIDPVRKSFCGAKWYNATIWLGHGGTTVCHVHTPD